MELMATFRISLSQMIILSHPIPVSPLFVSHTASKDLAQTSYFMATNRLLSCPSFVALWLHTIASSNAGYPVGVQRALLALVVVGMLAISCQLPAFVQKGRGTEWLVALPAPVAVRCIVQGTTCWHRGVECKMWSIVVRFKPTHLFGCEKVHKSKRKTLW